MSSNRRQFFSRVGRSMLLAGLGSTVASDLGLGVAFADDDTLSLDFGELEPLVCLMQETAPTDLTRILVQRLNSGDNLRTFVAAGALANARTFAGQDYIGFHTFMALAPAYRMSQALPAKLAPLPILKVLHRNATRIQEHGGRTNELLRNSRPEPLPPNAVPGEYLRQVARTGDMELADRTFIALNNLPTGEAFNHLQFEVHDEVDVHRVVLAWRAIDTLEFAGEKWANCLLRQSVRYCAQTENQIQNSQRAFSPIRQVLPALLDQYKLLERELGNKTGDDLWINELANVIFRGSRELAADAVAQALNDGFSTESIGEAISVAANLLVLHDPGRPQEWSSDEKPQGSCHGDSVGVHASDAANAWRNITRISNDRNIIASLIVGAYHTGGQSGRSNPNPYPIHETVANIKSNNPENLLSETEEAIRNKEQLLAAALVKRYSELSFPEQPMFNLMLRFATSEDGALHAEKYFNTAYDEFYTTRKSFRWNQLIALARVTASEFGRTSPGYLDAKEILGTTV